MTEPPTDAGESSGGTATSADGADDTDSGGSSVVETAVAAGTSDRWLLAWGLGSVAFGAASLLVPLFVVRLGGTATDLGVLAASAALIGAPGAIVFGRLADRVDARRPLVVATLAVVAAVLAVVPLLPSLVRGPAVPLTPVGAVVVANAVLWLFVAAVAPVTTMLVVDGSPEAAWATRVGRLNQVGGIGWAVGLVLGTVWPTLAAWLFAGPATTTLFWVLSACAVLSAVLAAVTLPRPTGAGHVTSRRRVRRIARLVADSRRGVKGATFAFSPNRLYWSTRELDLDRLRTRFGPALVTYLLAVVAFAAGSAAFWAPLPLFLTDRGFGEDTVFGLFLLSSVGSAVLYAPVGRLAERVDVRRLQTGALLVRSLAFPAVALAGGVTARLVGAGGSLVVLGVLFLVAGATWAVMAVVGTAIVTRLAPPSVRGEVLGVHAAVAAVAGGAGGIVGGWAAGAGFQTAFLVAGGLVFVGAVLVASMRVLSEG